MKHREARRRKYRMAKERSKWQTARYQNGGN